MQHDRTSICDVNVTVPRPSGRGAGGGGAEWSSHTLVPASTQADLWIATVATCSHPGDERVAIIELEPLLDAVDVGPDRRRRESQPSRDDHVLQTISHEEDNLTFPSSQTPTCGIGPQRRT